MHHRLALTACVTFGAACGTTDADDASDTDATASGAAIDITDALSPVDNCPLVVLNVDAWGAISARWHDDAEPHYELVDDEPGFTFRVELYTERGDGWVGELGKFPTNCETHGICVTLCPTDDACFEATGRGQIDIQRLLLNGGIIERPVRVALSGLTFRGAGDACYHVDDVTLALP